MAIRAFHGSFAHRMVLSSRVVLKASAFLFLISAWPSIAYSICSELSWMARDDIPPCPPPGSALKLDETYPAMAVVVPWDRAGANATMALDLVYQTVLSTTDRPPLIVLAGFPAYDSVELTADTLDQISDSYFNHLPKEHTATHELVRLHFQKLLLAGSKGHPQVFPMESAQHKKLFDSLAERLSRERRFLGKSPGYVRSQILRQIVFPEIYTQPVEKGKFATAQQNGIYQSFPWQQDYFLPSYDSKTGMPNLHAVARYRTNDPRPRDYYLRGVQWALARRCSNEFQHSHAVPSMVYPDYVAKDSSSGGNFLGLPGGLLLVGDNQERQANHELSQRPENLVKFSVSWLGVGHVDEVLGVVPDATVPPPCNFAISVISPKLGLKLLKETDSASKKFFDFTDPEQNPFSTLVKEIQPTQFTLDERYQSNRAQAVCDLINRHRNQESQSAAKVLLPGSCTESTSLLSEKVKNIFENLPVSMSLTQQGKVCDPKTLTNREVAAALESTSAGSYNALIEEEIQASLKSVLQSISQRTGCSSIKTIQLPALFYGGEPIEQRPETMVTTKNGTKLFGSLSLQEKKELPLTTRYTGLPSRRALSVLPNPVNALQLEKTVIVPHPQNASYLNHIKQSYLEIGIEPQTADSWQKNIFGGNIHCSTNKIPGCRPKTSQ